MKTIGLIGKKLSREEQKQISGGKLHGCATSGIPAWYFDGGCCTGLIACVYQQNVCVTSCEPL
ncbi:MAG TPA: hypothetical protein VJ602_02800 [Paludibacter sp.]|nr:hypothetical protein [Paludibacter sp.]